MRGFLRTLAGIIGLALLAAGGFGLLSTYAPTAEITGYARAVVKDAVPSLGRAGFGLSAAQLERALGEALPRLALAPLGLLLLVAAMLPRRFPPPPAAGEPRPGEVPLDRRLRRRARRRASALARKGQTSEAAELLLGAGDSDRAVTVFVEAGELVRAAEIRHDQNRFVEAAELYFQAGVFESAGRIFGQKEEWARAAESYVRAGRISVAGEMFEKAGDLRRAGDCFREVEFLRHAAQAYVGCQAWMQAAECLEQAYTEEAGGARGIDPARHGELERLVRQAAALFERGGDVGRAQAVLERGGCHREAAEAALRLERFARAADLFIDAGDAQRAADALRRLGEEGEAERVLGEFCRGQGELKPAAEHFERAGEHAAAGDLFRQIEEFARAGACYAACAEHAQAAEMYQLCGDRRSAAESYEQAGRFQEAAECCAVLGEPEREGALLERAGSPLGAGEVYHREGMDDAAIRVLQQVELGDPGFPRAAALLGDIFQARGQLSLAVQKLEQAIGDGALDRETAPLHYSLAAICEAQGDARRAALIYEKILAFDYHFRDVEQRLIQVREVVKNLGPAEPTGPETGSSHAISQSGTPGRYQVTGELGRGGMGIVYKARDTVLDRLVAYKVLPDALKENPQALKNFLREAKAAAKLNHPNIVTVYDAGEQDGRYYIAMEYVDGTTLKEILRRRGVISASSVLHVLGQICEALAYAHAKKVVHRDIKTANAMWTRDKKAKIMDFGLAKVVEEVRNHTTVVSGTPYYMSPEQTLGKNVDHRTDIYSLGVTVFELATGTVPFREGNIPYHHVHTPAPDIREVRPELPEALARIVNRCLQKDPDARYPSTTDILAEVREALATAARPSR